MLKPYHASEVLILDEFGYVPADPDIGPILYKVIASRCEKKATIITSNKSLTEGAASYPTRSSPPPSSIACSITARSTTSGRQLPAAREAARP